MARLVGLVRISPSAPGFIVSITVGTTLMPAARSPSMMPRSPAPGCPSTCPAEKAWYQKGLTVCSCAAWRRASR
ncbi:hypothetical protein [Streptomyces sp. ISL-100]|uniref:hypothetical protein n=1 Tax=Streptomyces sp. ISL-100 TaxID=2819173 RepID=UPI0020352D10|nr:hypothetical protein [Streptomyces sp. ISL-100]